MGKIGGNSWLNAVKKAFRSPTKDIEKRRSRRTEENEKEEEERENEVFSRKSLFQETTIQHNEAKDLIASSANSSVTTTLPTNSVAETADASIPGMEKDVSKINYGHVCKRYYMPSGDHYRLSPSWHSRHRSNQT